MVDWWWMGWHRSSSIAFVFLLHKMQNKTKRNETNKMIYLWLKLSFCLNAFKNWLLEFHVSLLFTIQCMNLFGIIIIIFFLSTEITSFFIFSFFLCSIHKHDFLATKWTWRFWMKVSSFYLWLPFFFENVQHLVWLVDFSSALILSMYFYMFWIEFIGMQKESLLVKNS